MNAFRILLADDHPIFRLGLCTLIGSHEGWEVCGEAADGRDAVEKCLQLKPDLVILEICMPRLCGGDSVRQILKDNPAQRVLILTALDSERVARNCLQAGVQGWVLKSDGAGALTTAVEAMQRHNCIFSLPVSDLLIRGQSKLSSAGATAGQGPQLTAREREVLQLLAEGRTARDVAVVLNISVKTAETHRSNMMLKLNLHSIAQLVLYAVRNEIIYVRSPVALPELGNELPNVTLQSLN
jgi:DNA-binding NarL/FixJ family response regulator